MTRIIFLAMACLSLCAPFPDPVQDGFLEPVFSAEENGQAGWDILTPMQKEEILCGALQKDSRFVGAGYNAIYLFLPDHSFYYMAEGWGLREPAQEKETRILQTGQWSLGGGTLTLTVLAEDWYTGGRWAKSPSGGWYLENAVCTRKTPNNRIRLPIEIKKETGAVFPDRFSYTVSIGGFWYYPFAYLWEKKAAELKAWFAEEPAANAKIPGSDISFS